ncbi:MAG: fused MFS/spermidine synthase [Armatimonadetes bacterium]|nr:fused MFS/spermidine synthase [Armatimonadota bacterium]
MALDSARRPDALQRAVLGMFLVSGAVGLVYEVVWLRVLTLVFGATTLSSGCVLAAYMAGLALGSWFWSRRADRCPRPLRLYGRLELGVALSAAASPWLFGLVKTIYRQLFSGGLSDFTWLSAARFVLCLPALLLPTFLMGGTFPAMARWYSRTLDVGRSAAGLYAANTVGATIGTLAAGVWLIPRFGVQGTLAAAVVANLAVAALAIRLDREPLAEADEEPPDVPDEAPVSLAAVRVVWAGFAVSGFAAMVYEVAWTRGLVQVFGNSTYAFTAMLASFLVGLSFGSALAGKKIRRIRDPVACFARVEAWIALSAVAATACIGWLPGLLLEAFKSTGGDFAPLFVFQLGLCWLLMLPATLGLGFILPLVAKLSAPQLGGAGRGVGLPYAWNTVGAVLGAAAAGFWILPRCGVEKSVALAAALNLSAGAAAWLAAPRSSPSRRPALALGLLGLLGCVRLALVEPDPRVLSAGVYCYPQYFLKMQAERVPVRRAMLVHKLLYHEEGYCGTIAVLNLRSGHRVLQANGKTDASTGDLSTQRLVAHLPLLLKPDARDVMVVGLASGCTVGSALLHPIQHVDCIEIEPAMLRAARYFDDYNHRCLDDPRLTVILQDARNYVLLADRQYDLITAEPTNPWIAGVNSLFTLDYYRLCARRLRPGGMMCQWLPAYNFNPGEMRSALASFARVFPHVTLWAFPRLRADFVAIGTFEPQRFPALAARERLTGRVLDDLACVGVSDIWTLAGGLLLDEPGVRGYLSGARLNTDDDPWIEFSTPHHMLAFKGSRGTVEDTYAGAAASRLVPDAGFHRAYRLAGGPPPPAGSGPPVLRPCHPAAPSSEATLHPEFTDIAVVEAAVNTAEGPAVWRATPVRADAPPTLAALFPSGQTRRADGWLTATVPLR